MKYKVLMNDIGGRGLYLETVEAKDILHLREIATTSLIGEYISGKEAVESWKNIAYHKGYKVFVEETLHFKGYPRGRLFVYVIAENEEEVKDYVNKNHGELYSISKEMQFIDKSTKLPELKDGQEYFLYADKDSINDVLSIMKIGNQMYTKLIGGELDRPYTQGYKLKEALDKFHEYDWFEEFELNSLTLSELEVMDAEIYETVSIQNPTPKDWRTISLIRDEYEEAKMVQQARVSFETAKNKKIASSTNRNSPKQTRKKKNINTNDDMFDDYEEVTSIKSSNRHTSNHSSSCGSSSRSNHDDNNHSNNHHLCDTDDDD